MRNKALFTLAGALTLMSGCANDSSDSVEERSGVHAGATADPHSDTAIIRYTIKACDSDAVIDVRDVVLEDQVIPGNLAELANNPLDEGSAHYFADYFEVLPAGCYSVIAEPLKEDLSHSEVCYDAWSPEVLVEEGKMTETLLILQCEGVDPGAIDVIAAINHDPELIDFNFEESKFACGFTNRVCVDASDVDGDPVEIVVSAGEGCEVKHEDAVTDELGVTSRCAEITCDEAGRHDVSADVYDLAWKGGELIRIEQWLFEAGYGNPSRAELDLHSYFDGSDCNVCASADSDLEFVMIQDLSGSFWDDLPNVKTLAPLLFDGLDAKVASLRAGVASYIDKPWGSFGAPTDYVYKQHLALTDVKADFTAAINALSTGSGVDTAEAQIEALQALARNSASYGFSPSATKIVVVTTDAPFHQAGDCTIPSLCDGENDGDGNVEGTSNPADYREDYPTRVQTRNALTDAGIFPIFAVTADQMPFYETFVDEDLGGYGKVVELDSKSENLVDLIDTVICPPAAD